MKTIGVLAYQGDVQRHVKVVERLGAVALTVRDPGEIAGLDGLIIPGGESTTIGLLLTRFGTGAAVCDAIGGGMPVFGTCAGAILLAKEIENSDQYRIGAMDVSITRNAYGRQVDSFEAEFPVPTLGISSTTGVFIRAPVIRSVGPNVRVLAQLEESPVLVQQENLLAATFHPELSQDVGIHSYFLSLAG